VKEHPQVDFSRQIIKGALNIFAYDGQSEGDRAQYIFDIMGISPQKSNIRKAVLAGLAAEKEDTWNLTHLFAITRLLAEQNDAEAKQAIYDRFLTNVIYGSDWAGATEILELDGLEGLFFIAEKYGKYLLQHPDNLQDDDLITSFQKQHEHLNVFEALEKKAQTNRFIRIYLDNIRLTSARVQKPEEKPIYKDIVEEALNTKRLFFFRARNLTDQEIQALATQLMQEKNTSHIEKLLAVFDHYPYPFDSKLILDLAKRNASPNHLMTIRAIRALKHLKSKEIRDFALHAGKKKIDFLALLTSNYERGDGQLLSDVANRINNKDQIENLATIFVAIYTANKTPECKEPLEILYRKMNCALHRYYVVSILLENQVLSERLQKEIPYDCDLKTRALLPAVPRSSR
jgi:hypothetical protein